MASDPDVLPVACGQEAAALLGRLLGDELVAVWLTGSGALGGVAPGLSDVDVVAVTATGLPEERRRALAAALAELAMTWPLRGSSSCCTPGARWPGRSGAHGSRSTSTPARGCRTGCRWTRPPNPPTGSCSTWPSSATTAASSPPPPRS